MTGLGHGLASALLALAAGSALGTGGGDAGRTTSVTIGSDEMSYYRRSTSIVDSILAGDLGAAQNGISGLESVSPAALVFADVHNAIGVAFGESGHFEAGIAHIGKALERRDASPPGLVGESQAYLAYFHTAALQFAKAARVFRALHARPPWLHAKLAAAYVEHGHYACAAANAEEALRAGRAGGAVASRWTASRAGGTVDREAVLEEWSRRLEVFRKRRTAEGETSADAAPAVCVGA